MERTYSEEQLLRLVFLAKIYERKTHHHLVGEQQQAAAWREIYKSVERGRPLAGTDTWAGDAFAHCFQMCRITPENYDALRDRFFKTEESP